LGVDVDAVLAANSTFEGNLTITNAAELAFAKSLGTKVASIKGDVIVIVDEPSATAFRPANTGNGVTAAEVNTVLSQITFVVGNVRITTDASLDLSKLTTVSGDYSVVGHDIDDSALASVGDDVYVDYDGPISFPALTSADRIYVKGTYVTTAAASVAADTAAGTLKIGTTSIDFMGLTKATSISILNATHTSGGSHTSGSSATINDSGWPTGELYLSASTTSVKIGQAPVTLVTGAGLTDLELHYAANTGTAAQVALYPGLSTTGSAALGNLSITAPKLVTGTVMARRIGSITVDAVASTATTATGTVNFPEALFTGAISSDALANSFPKVVNTGGVLLANQVSVSLPAMTLSTGAISLTKATSFSAAALVRLGSSATVGVNLTAPEVTGAASFPALTLAGAISMPKVTSFDAKAAVVTSVDLSAEATSLDVASIATVGGIADLATLETINLHAQAVTIDLSGAVKATSITILGKTSDVNAAFNLSTGYTELASLTLGGKLGTVSVSNGAADGEFVKLVTAGTIHKLTVNNNAELTTLTLGHTEDVTLGSEITITNNTELGTFTTSADRVTTFIVTGNTKLGSFNASSIKTLPNNFATVSAWTFTVTGNTSTVTSGDANEYADRRGIKGTYTALSASVNRAYGQASLATLKPYFQALYDKAHPATGAVSIDPDNIAISMDYVTDNTPTGTENYAVHTQVLSTEASIVAPSTKETFTSAVVTAGSPSDAEHKAQMLEILKLQ
ncbi:hypothetical protein, partial [Nonlabens sp.]|uniref:hypothetical protein n=1 Tax=Nonlabens sp. TaxID=1888209 RepID=UPI001BCA775F